VSELQNIEEFFAIPPFTLRFDMLKKTVQFVARFYQLEPDARASQIGINTATLINDTGGF